MTRPFYALIVGSLLCLTTPLLRVNAKVFTHCELAQELRRQQIPESQIATWVCIAHYESRLNTSAISGTGDHGIFQISEEYWCSPPGRGKGCGLSCASLEDDDIRDDVACIQTIFEEHNDLSGNGFTAWAVYPRCKTSSANRFIKTCSAGSVETDNAIDSPPGPPLDLRISGYPSYLAGSPLAKNRDSSSYYTKSSVYTPNQDYSYTRSTEAPSYYTKSSVYTPNQDYSYTRSTEAPSYYTKSNVYTPNQDYSYTRSTEAPIIYTKPSVYTPSQEYTYTRPPKETFTFYSNLNPVNPAYYTSEQNPNREYVYSRHPFESSAYTPTRTYSTTSSPPQIFLFNPSKSFTSARPSSYSIGSIYYNAGSSYFDDQSSTPAPTKVYSYTPNKTYSTSISSNFNKDVTNYSQYTSTTAAPQYKSYTRSEESQIKTSSPATVRIRAPWEDFPWWNGGNKRKYI